MFRAVEVCFLTDAVGITFLAVTGNGADRT